MKIPLSSVHGNIHMRGSHTFIFISTLLWILKFVLPRWLLENHSVQKTFRNRMTFLLLLFQFGLWRTSERVLFPFVASSVQSVLRSVWVFCKWYVHCSSESSIAVCGQLSRVVGILCIDTACCGGDNFPLCYCQPISVSAFSLVEAPFTLR